MSAPDRLYVLRGRGTGRLLSGHLGPTAFPSREEAEGHRKALPFPDAEEIVAYAPVRMVTVPRVEYFKAMGAGGGGRLRRVGLFLREGRVEARWVLQDGGTIPPAGRNGWAAGPCDDAHGWAHPDEVRADPAYLRALAALYENPTEEVEAWAD